MLINKATAVIDESDDVPAIICLICKRRSYHPVDIKESYCANCGVFHQNVWVSP